MNDMAFEEIAERLLQTLYERMMFRSAEVYSEGWAVEKIKSALCEAAHLTPGAADTATPREVREILEATGTANGALLDDTPCR